MMQIGLIGVAAGAASALLFASFASGSLLSIPLFYLAPLPILIAALGWGHLAGLIASLVASTVLGAIFGGLFFVSFMLGVGLPAWWLAYLAMLGRATPDGGVEWYPIGRIAVWAALIASVIVMLVLFTLATDSETLRSELRKIFEPLLRANVPSPRGGSERSTQSFLRLLAEYPDLVLPPAAAVLTTIVTVFTLWLAGRIVRISGRLRRPWPDLAAMTFPPFALPVLVAAGVASVLTSGLVGIFAMILTSSLLTAFGFLGLAVLHALTRRLNGRGFMLGGVYGAIVVFGWPLLLMALLGLIDMALNLRTRFAGRGPPPLNNQPQG
jgi:hypothetical protein